MSVSNPERKHFSNSCPESPRVISGESEISRLSKLTRSIGGGILNNPVESVILGFTVLYLGYHVVRGWSTFNARLDQLEETTTRLVAGNENSLVVPFDRGARFIQDQLGYLGDVIPTGTVGVRIIEPEGVNVRYLPDKVLGPRVKTGRIEPYYKVLQFHEYDANPLKQVSHFFKTKDGNIWAVTWSDPDKTNGNLRYLELFAVYHDKQWLADFVVDGQIHSTLNLLPT